METIQTFIQTIWASVLAIGTVKAIIAVVAIAVLSKYQYILGMLAVLERQGKSPKDIIKILNHFFHIFSIF